jgi:hypothetical protein
MSINRAAQARVTDDGLTSALASYPRIASCSACRTFAVVRAPAHVRHDLLAATLAHHDSGHVDDPLAASSQHFG